MAGPPLIKPIILARGIPKAVLNLDSAPFGRSTNLMSPGDEDASDAALISTGRWKCIMDG